MYMDDIVLDLHDKKVSLKRKYLEAVSMCAKTRHYMFIPEEIGLACRESLQAKLKWREAEHAFTKLCDSI